jgi:hypothetical protein
MTADNDPRRHRIIETRFHGTPPRYDLTIDGVLWSEVEWSASRQAWCVQDAAGHCLTHVEHIHAQDADAEAAVRLARKMIRDGRMPTPEQAARQLRERQVRKRQGKQQGKQHGKRQEYLGEPWELLPELTPEQVKR